MSQVRPSLTQTSFSLIALIASTIALGACSKHSLVEKSGEVTSAQKAEAPLAQEDAAKASATAVQCPTILGTFTNTAGEEVVYTMASVEGGVSYTRNGQTTIVDGKNHVVSGNVTETYVATCGAGELKIVSTKADQTTSTRVVRVEEVGDSGDVNLQIEVDGVGSTTPLRKVVAAPKAEVVPAADVTTTPVESSVTPDASASESAPAADDEA